MVPIQFSDTFSKQMQSLVPVQGAIQTKRAELEKKRAELAKIVQDRALEKMGIPEPGKISSSEALSAGLVAAIGRLMGARDQYAQGGLQNYIGGRQSQIKQDYALESARAEEDFRQRQALADAGIFSAQQGIRGLEGEIAGLESAQSAERKRLADEAAMKYEQAQLNNRAELSSQTRLTLKEMDVASREWVTQNPSKAYELATMVRSLLDSGLIDADQADTIVKSEIANRANEARLKGAQADKAQEQAMTESETRDAKIKEILSRVGVNNARAQHFRAVVGSLGREIDIRELNAAANFYRATKPADLTAEDIAGMDSYIKRLVDERNAIQKALITANSALAGSTGEEAAGIAAMVKEYQSQLKILGDEIKTAEAERKKLVSPPRGSGGVAPFDPLRGAIVPRGGR